MFKYRQIFLFLFFLVLAMYLTIPVIANAQKWGWWRPIVPCGINSDPSRNQPCEFCDIFKLFKNILDFFTFELVPPLTAGFFAYAGILLLISSGDSRKKQQAKRIATDVVIGFVLVYGAWLIVTTLMEILFSGVDQDNDWWKIECKGPSIPTPLPTLTSSPSPTPLPTGKGSGLILDVFHTDEQYSMFAAPELKNVLGCLNDKMKDNGLTAHVTAIADMATWRFFKTGGIDGQNCFLNYSKPPCGHSLKNSCHYGGNSDACHKAQKSYSMDINNTGSLSKNQTIVNLAKECGAASARIESNPTHIHIDAQNNCGCPAYNG